MRITLRTTALVKSSGKPPSRTTRIPRRRFPGVRPAKRHSKKMK